jgi:hypothetical protein
MKSDERRFSEEIRVRCPSRMTPMIDRAAERRCMKPSEFIRMSIVERLMADGFNFGEAS